MFGVINNRVSICFAAVKCVGVIYEISSGVVDRQVEDWLQLN